MKSNAQIWRVVIPFVNTSKVVKLPNTHNSIYEALRSESQKPERKKWLEAQKMAEWAGSRASCTEVSDRQFGHSLYRLLAFLHPLVLKNRTPKVSLKAGCPLVYEFTSFCINFNCFLFYIHKP